MGQGRQVLVFLDITHSPTAFLPPLQCLLPQILHLDPRATLPSDQALTSSELDSCRSVRVLASCCGREAQDWIQRLSFSDGRLEVGQARELAGREGMAEYPSKG